MLGLVPIENILFTPIYLQLSDGRVITTLQPISIVKNTKIIYQNVNMSPKITTYFQKPKTSRKSVKLTKIKDEIDKEKDLYVLQHDHAYVNRKLNPQNSIQISRKKLKEAKKKPKRLNPNENKLKSNTKQTLTDYFPVRRSFRKSRSNLLKEKRNDFEDAILSQREDGLIVETFSNKGRGVRATKHFRRGDFVVEYSGELIDIQEAKNREKMYSKDENTGCYMYYFAFSNKHYCVDATAESHRLGRLINHSRHGNLTTKTFVVNDKPHLILIAKQDIEPGQELLYDYGDRNKTSLLVCPWLAT